MRLSSIALWLIIRSRGECAVMEEPRRSSKTPPVPNDRPILHTFILRLQRSVDPGPRRCQILRHGDRTKALILGFRLQFEPCRSVTHLSTVRRHLRSAGLGTRVCSISGVPIRVALYSGICLPHEQVADIFRTLSLQQLSDKRHLPHPRAVSYVDAWFRLISAYSYAPQSLR